MWPCHVEQAPGLESLPRPDILNPARVAHRSGIYFCNCLCIPFLHKRAGASCFGIVPAAFCGQFQLFKLVIAACINQLVCIW